MKNYFLKIKNKHINKLKNNKKYRICYEYFIGLILTFISASFLAIGFKVFLSPNVEHVETIVAGGASGLSKTIGLIFQLCGSNYDQYSIYSIAYLIINLPIGILSFKLGKKYAILSLINVVLVSTLTNFINIDLINNFASNIACVYKLDENTYLQLGVLTRLILGAMFSGAGTVIAFYAGSSSGGVDTVAQYLSFKKRTTVGLPFFIINSAIIFIFGILTLVEGYRVSSLIGLRRGVLVIVYAYIYQMMISVVIDILNRAYRKERLQIITSDESLSKIILENSHHGLTIIKAKGAYSKKDNYVMYTVVNQHEKRHLIEVLRRQDSNCFINVVSIKKVYGKFAII